MWRWGRLLWFQFVRCCCYGWHRPKFGTSNYFHLLFIFKSIQADIVLGIPDGKKWLTQGTNAGAIHFRSSQVELTYHRIESTQLYDLSPHIAITKLISSYYYHKNNTITSLSSRSSEPRVWSSRVIWSSLPLDLTLGKNWLAFWSNLRIGREGLRCYCSWVLYSFVIFWRRDSPRK